MHPCQVKLRCYIMRSSGRRSACAHLTVHTLAQHSHCPSLGYAAIAQAWWKCLKLLGWWKVVKPSPSIHSFLLVHQSSKEQILSLPEVMYFNTMLCHAPAKIQNTQEIKRMLFNWTKQDKTCTFLRKSSFSSYVQHKDKQLIQLVFRQPLSI